MSLETPNQSESIPVSEIEIETDFEGFVPEEFRTDPFGYFQTKGRNIKSGEVLYSEQGEVREDPTATKDLPVWKNRQGEELLTVGKKVNTAKSQVEKSADPFYEYSIMEIAKEFDLPAPIPIAKVKRNDEHLIVMRKVEGIRWTEEGMRVINDSDLTEVDKQSLLSQAQEMMEELQHRYERIGLKRGWKLKDMVFDVDIPNRKVLKVTPTDWERTKIDLDKLTRARQEKV